MKKALFLLLCCTFASACMAQDDVEKKITKILNKMNVEDKIYSQTYSHCVLGALIKKEKDIKKVCPNDTITKETQQLYDDLLSKKVNVDTRDLYHMFTAQNVIKYHLGQLAGCTGASRVFLYYARKPEYHLDVKYVVSEQQGNYVSACSKPGTERDDTVTINGHQVVAVKLSNGKWRILNTSQPTITYATYYEGPDKDKIVEVDDINSIKPTKDKQFKVKYGDMVGFPFIVAAVLDDDNVYSHKTLMNYSVSGNSSSDLCSWSVQ